MSRGWQDREQSLKTRNNSAKMQRKIPAQGLADHPREESAKGVLAAQVNKLIDSLNLSQSEVASLTGMTQPKVSQIRRYRLKNISLERLMQALISLGQRVEIVVRPAHEKDGTAITVAA